MASGEGTVRLLRLMLPAIGIVAAAVAPAAAQRYNSEYPVCLQKWEWGGSSTIYCSYTSWDQCQATAAGLAAMCLVNPYWSQANRNGPTALPGRKAGSGTW